MSSRDACSLVIMLGIAMLTMVRSSRVMKNPSDTTSSTAHGLPRNLLTVTPWPSHPAVMACAPKRQRTSQTYQKRRVDSRYILLATAAGTIVVRRLSSSIVKAGTDKRAGGACLAGPPDTQRQPVCSGHETQRNRSNHLRRGQRA